MKILSSLSFVARAWSLFVFFKILFEFQCNIFRLDIFS